MKSGNYVNETLCTKLNIGTKLNNETVNSNFSIFSASIKTEYNIFRTATTSTTTKSILHFFNEILQLSKFKFFVSRDKFSSYPQIFLKFANVKHNWKIRKLNKILFWKIPKNWHVYWDAAHQNEKLARLWYVYWHVVT